MSFDPRRAIREHWAPRGDLGRVRRLMNARGLEPSELTPEDLAGVDQLHAGLLEGTRAFAEWIGLGRGARVLDVGAGLGGPARWLASRKGWNVTALEMTPELHRAGRELTGWLGLEGEVEHVLGDVHDVELRGVWDAVLVQHVDMHLDDKPTAYQRLRDWLAPAAEAAVYWHDWHAGPGGPVVLPVPWASSDLSTTFLSTLEEQRRLLADAGLEVTRHETLVDSTAAWYAASRDGLRRLIERSSGEKRRVLQRTLEEVEGILRNVVEGRVVPYWMEARRRGRHRAPDASG